MILQPHNSPYRHESSLAPIPSSILAQKTLTQSHPINRSNRLSLDRVDDHNTYHTLSNSSQAPPTNTMALPVC